MSRSLIFLCNENPRLYRHFNKLELQMQKNIKLNDSAAPIVMAEFFMHFCFNEFMFTDILYSVYVTYLQVLFKTKRID